MVQTAAKLVLEPIFEAGFEDNAYGYRPARGAVDAVKEVHQLIYGRRGVAAWLELPGPSSTLPERSKSQLNDHVRYLPPTRTLVTCPWSNINGWDMSILGGCRPPQPNPNCPARGQLATSGLAYNAF